MKTLDEVLDPYNENKKLEEDALIKLEQEIFDKLINYDIVDLVKHIYNRINSGELENHKRERILLIYGYIQQIYDYIKREFINDNPTKLDNNIQEHKDINITKNKNLLML